MRVARKTLMLLLTAVMLVAFSGTIGIEAEPKIMDPPTFSIKTKKTDASVKIKMLSSYDIEGCKMCGYDIRITGISNNLEDGKLKKLNSKGELGTVDEIEEWDHVYCEKSTNISVKYNDFLPGTYYVEVRFYYCDENWNWVETEWSQKEKIRISEKSESVESPKMEAKIKNKGDYIRLNLSGLSAGLIYIVKIRPANSEYCDYIKMMETDGRVYMRGGDYAWDTIVYDGKPKKKVTYKNLPPGTYNMSILAYEIRNIADGMYLNDEYKWSEEKKFTIKYSSENANLSGKGYLSDYDFSNVQKGEIIKFGSYEQDLDYTNGKEVIEWIVLDRTEDSLFLVSKYALERLPYNKEWKEVYWKDCTLRKWLNDVFVKSAFNKNERVMIKDTKLANSRFYEDGENATIDKVFLLSTDDMKNNDYGFYGGYDNENGRYIADINSRCAFAWYKNTNMYSGEEHLTKDGEDACWWWLREIYERADDCAVNVNAYGQINGNGNRVDDIDLNHGYFGGNCAGVRPAMYISLKSTE